MKTLDYVDAGPVPQADAVQADALGIERAGSFTRKVFELLLYVNVTINTFQTMVGFKIPYGAIGGFTLVLAFFCFFFFIIEGQKVPKSVWFILAVNLFANFSEVFGRGQTPIVGRDLKPVIHWLNYLIVTCYLVQNTATEQRMVIFFSAVIMAAVSLGGVERGSTTYGVRGRLEMVEGVAGLFGNANSMAHTAGLFGMACLFWSLRSRKLLRPVYWTLALLMIYVLIRTVSRGGIASFGCGLMVLMCAILMGRGVRLSGIVLALVAIVVAMHSAYLVSTYVIRLRERMTQASPRTEVYSKATLRDMWDTKVFGRGRRGARTRAAGIAPHNSFLFVHLAYGGPAAWIYLFWLMYLLLRVFRMLRSRELPLDVRLKVLALYGMALAAQILSNQGYIFFSTIFATAVVEKYTAPFTSKRMADRAQRWYESQYGYPLAAREAMSAVEYGRAYYQ